mgnify:CR=1 FL=1
MVPVEYPVRQLFFLLPLPLVEQAELIPVPIVQHCTDQIRVIGGQALGIRLFPGLFYFYPEMGGDPLAVLPAEQRPVLVQQRHQLGGVQFPAAEKL